MIGSRTGLLAACVASAVLAGPALGQSAVVSVGTTTAKAPDGSVITVRTPAGVVAGDVLVVAVTVRASSARTIVAPPGWRVVRRTAGRGGGARLAQAVFLRVAGDSEPFSATWTLRRPRGGAAAMLAYRGVDTARPVLGSSASLRRNTTWVTAPSLAAPVAGARLVGFFGASGAGRTSSPPGMTERYELTTRRWGVSTAGADRAQAAAGPTGARTARFGRKRGVAVGQAVALRPLDTEPPPAPTDLHVAGRSQISVTLDWTGSGDGVAGYGVYRDGVHVSEVGSSSHTVSGLACDTQYSFEVDAFDEAGNRSGRANLRMSTSACATLGSALPPLLPSSTGAVYYVSPAGSDANPGTFSAPWRTVQKALDTLTAGERALVRAGTYFEDLEFDRAGTASAPISVEAYPGEQPILNPVAGHPLVVSSDGAYFRLSGFVVEKAPGTSGGNIDVYGHDVELSGNEIRLGTDQGIYTAEESANVHVLANWIHHNGKGIAHQSHGIYLQGSDHYVANNVIHDHPKGFGIQVYDLNHGSVIVGNTIVASGHSGIVVGGSGGVSDVVVRNNVLAFNARYGVQRDSTCPTSNVTVDHNVIYGNPSGAVQSGCPAIDTSVGNIFADPSFLDYVARDLRLAADSPALDEALADWTPTTDAEGAPRPQGSGPDVGAYEG